MTMDKPIHFKNVLDPFLFDTINETLHNDCKWILNNRSYSGVTLNWGIHSSIYELLFVKAATIIKLKILGHIRKNIKLCKIHCNGQTSNQISQFHHDFDTDDSWTFVLFTEKYWNTQWGGEFVVSHPVTGEYFYNSYIPNSGVLIPAIWEHCGHPPFPCTDSIRTTIAFSYMELNEYYKNLSDKEDKNQHLYCRYY